MLQASPALFRLRLRAELDRRCQRNPRYSLRAYARALGFGATGISEMLAGRRLPSPRSAQKLVSRLGLSPADRRDFLLSVAAAEQLRGIARRVPVGEGDQGTRELSHERFRIVADWHHYAILALSQTEGFRPEAKAIASRLGISAIEAKLAVERLLGLGLLTQGGAQGRRHVNGRGGLVASDEGFTTADKELTSTALRQHQRQILEKAIYSLENDEPETRSQTSFTMAVDPARLPEARKLIEDFTQTLCRLMQTGRKTRVYELGVSLFPLDRKESKK